VQTLSCAPMSVKPPEQMLYFSKSLRASFRVDTIRWRSCDCGKPRVVVGFTMLSDDWLKSLSQ